VFLARHASGTYAHHQEHYMLSCSIWFSAPSFGWVVVLRAAAWVVCGWCRVTESHGTIRTLHTTHAVTLKTTTLPKTRCRKPCAATQHLMLLMMGYVPEACRAKITSIKLPYCIKLVISLHFINNVHGRCAEFRNPKQ